MKKTFTRILALTLVAVVLLACLAGCGNSLSGKYTLSGGILGDVSYTFSGSKLTVSYTSVLGTVNSAEGKYELKDGNIIITMNDSDGSSYAGTYTFSKGKNDSGKEFVKIGNLTYTKA